MNTELDQLLPPHDRKAEQALIGCMLRDNGQYDDAAKIVKASDFYQHAHQVFFRGISDLIAIGNRADPVTIADWLKDNKVVEDAGGYGYITELWDAAPVITGAKHYAEIVRDHSVCRQMIHAASEIQKEAWRPGCDPKSLLARAEALIFDVSQSQKTGQVIDFQTAVDGGLEALDRRQGRAADGECDADVKYGWPLLDRLTGGLHPRELIVLAARPSVGKTLIAMSIVEHVASGGGRVFFASIEQGYVELVHRTLGKRAKVPSGKFRTAAFTNEERDRLDEAAAEAKRWPIWINDHSSQTVADIASDARRIKMRNGLDLVVVDYLQIVRSENARSNRNEQVGNISWRLKQLAKDLSVPVIALSQLNRAVENRPDSEPRLSDLRESGEIEQNADTVIMLHKPESPDSSREADVLKFLVRKQRNGPLGSVTAVHSKKYFEVQEAVIQ